MAAEGSDDRAEYESRSSSELVNEKPGASRVCSERGDVVGEPRRSIEVAEDILNTDAEASTKTEVQHPVADSKDPTARSATSEGPSERGETADESHQPKQRRGSDVLESQVLQEAPIEGTNHAGRSSGATASGDMVGQRSDGDGTASAQNPDNLGGSIRNSASNGDSAFATETAIPTTESTLRTEQLTQSRLSADQLEGLSKAEHAATFAEDVSMPLSFEERSTRESFAGESVETASLTTGSEGSDPSACGAAVWPPSGEVRGVVEGDGATVVQNVLDDSALVAASQTRSAEDGSKRDPHQPPSSYDLTQHASRGCEGYPAAAPKGGGHDTFADGPDLERVSHIVADAQKLVNEAISSSLVAIAAAVAAMARDNKSPKQELVTRTADLQDLPRFDEDSPLFEKASCLEKKSHDSSGVQAQKEEPAWPLRSSELASLRMNFVEDFLSHVYEVASAMGAAAATTTMVKTTTPAIAEQPKSIVAIDETLSEIPLGVKDEPVDLPIRLESPEHMAEPEPGAESGVNEPPPLLAGETRARSTTAAGEADRRPTGEVDPGEGQGATEISHIVASPSDDALPPSLPASVRSAVVADYLSEAIPASILVTEVSPSNCSADLEAPPSTVGIADVSRSLCLGEEDSVSSSALMNDSLPERQPQPKGPPSSGNELTLEEDEDEGVAEPTIRDTASGATPTALSETLCSAVVEEYMSGTLPRVVAAASPRAGEPVDAEVCAQSDQSLEKQRGRSATEGDDRDRSADDTSVSSTPPSTPDKQSPSEANADSGPETPFPPNDAAACEPVACQSLEASAYLMEIGDRAKRMQESSEKSRINASSWLRDTGSKALSSQVGEQSARKASAVVEAYLLETLRGVVASEVSPGTALATAPSSPTTSAPTDITMGAPGDHFTRDVSSRCGPLAADDGHHPTVDANDADPGAENSVSRPASRSSRVEGERLVGQTSGDRWETPSKGGGDNQDGGAPDALDPPTLGSPSGESLRGVFPKVGPNIPLNPSYVAGGDSLAPQCVDAAAYLVEVGTRAKSLQESSEKSRDDASSWLRETGSKALSSQGGEQAGRKASAVVEAYLLETLREVVASVAAPGTAVGTASSSPRTCADPDVKKVAKGDQAVPGASLPCDSILTATTDPDVEAESPTSGEVSISLIASCSSLAEATEAIGQEQDETLPNEEGEEQRDGVEQTSDGPGPPIPPGPRNGGMQSSDASRRQNSAEFSVLNAIYYGDRSPASRSAEALTYLTDVGSRAKSQQEAADWLFLAGGSAKSAEERAKRDRDDACSWLREAAVEALSLPARTSEDLREAAEWLLLAGGRAKSAQDRVENARINASSWLREKGGRALSLSDREQARRSECAAWLGSVGGRAKSAQGRADKARADASSWLRSAGLGAVSLQERTEGARSDAAAWLKTRAISELERTGPVEGRVEVLAEASLALRQGKPEAEDAGHPSECGRLNESPVTASDSPHTGYHSNITATEVVASGSSGRDIRQDTPPGDNEAVQPLERPSDDSTSSHVHPTVTNDASIISPPRQAPSLVEGEAAATSTTPTAADATSTDFEQPPGRTASTDRTARAPWLEPVTSPLVSTAAGTEDFGRMLGAGEKEWARVSLSRTPPFDALNSPSLPVRYAPVRGRPRPLPPDAEVFETGGAGAAAVAAGADPAIPAGEAMHRRVSGGGAGAAHNADGSGWVEFFAPPDQMAPRGDAYRGSDGCGSAEASASTTARADSSSAGSLTSSLAGHPRRRERDGSDNPHRRKQRDDEDREGDGHSNDRAWRFSGDVGVDGRGVGRRSSEEAWGETLGEVSHPAGEACGRMVDRISVASGSRWDETGSFSPASREVRGNNGGVSGHRAGGGKRWHKKAEQSRQYMRRWEAFLGRTHRYFDGEADVRKRMSLVRRAHPDVSNEVAYVALAQSRGRSSEAAAVLHLPRAKDEAAMVAMMLDVTSFIHLARQASERRRRSRHLERERRAIAARGRGEARGPFRRKGGADGMLPQSPTWACQELGEERWSGGGREGGVTDAEGYKGDMVTDKNGCRLRLRQEHRRREISSELLPAEACKRNANRSSSSSSSSSSSNDDDGGSRGNLQSRRSDSAPSLLPPIEGALTEGTPPSPGSLKAVLSTSKSVAVEVPVGLGFARKAGRSKKDESFERDRRGSKRTRRDLKAVLWARARWQRQRMAEMAAPGKQCPPHNKQGGGETLDALMERFLCETRTLDRDSEELNARLRGRPEKHGLSGRGLYRYGAVGSTGRQAGDGTTYGSNGGNSSTGHGPPWRDLAGLDGCQQPSSKTSSTLFLASVNSNLAAPFLSLPEGGDRVDDACFTSSSVTAASVCSLVDAGEYSRDRGSCRVQSYFAQALGDESLCEPKERHRA